MSNTYQNTCLVGIDIGGTFTDIILLQNEGITVTKVPSTPLDPSQAVINGLKELNITSGEFVHGTTIATNALLEKTGALTALITTKGFEDVLEIGRQSRPDLYDFNVQKPEPLANQNMRYGLTERTDSNGIIIEDLDNDLLEQIISQIKDSAAESVAVSLLFSFLNPAHEQLILEKLKSQIPLIYASISSEIVPEFREYERTSTVVINSYVGPKVSQYMDNLTSKVEHPIRVMQSSGGSITSQLASKEPVRTILSGPAGGVVGAYRTAKQAGIDQIISIDMGGTSTDVSICPNRIQETTQANISGYPISIPMIEIHTVGAGGGSIAAINAGGSLSVGPSSAGSDPGPACYGLGNDITVTDANLILGRIQPDFFLGGTIQLDVEKARDSITRLATEINSSETDAALGIIKVVNANMERAIRSISLERGHDPRDFALLPFGGAGALHACELSNEIGISTVFIPPYPGVLSALGVAIADISKDYSRTVMITPGHQMLEQLETEYNGMESNARSDFKSESLNTANLIFNRYIDIRYVGQSYELLIPFPASNIKDSEELQSLITTDFETAHQQRFGYCDTSQNIEVVNVRLKAVLPSTTQIPEANSPKASIDSKPIDKRPIYFQTTSLMTPVYNRQNIQVNQKIKGPALITQFDTSIPVFPGWVAQKDQLNNLILKSI
tara:strand:+ start:29108 stop:31126 length:2019 start_codon:yes stop_codon:yes gene_type:complete